MVLASGATAHTILRYSDVTVSTAPGCHPVFSTFELRVYPPNQFSATHAAFGLEACSHAGPIYLSVGAHPARRGHNLRLARPMTPPRGHGDPRGGVGC